MHFNILTSILAIISWPYFQYYINPSFYSIILTVLVSLILFGIDYFPLLNPYPFVAHFEKTRQSPQTNMSRIVCVRGVTVQIAVLKLVFHRNPTFGRKMEK